jgi:hydrogenase nickel incorporation protein HypA/HybF
VHEAGIAAEVIRIVEANVDEGDLARVTGVTVSVGSFSGVVPEALELAFQMMVTFTPLARAVMEIERIPTVARCGECGAESVLEDPIFVCEACGSMEVDLLSGTELTVASITLDDAP